mgnify:CR=1 FL=1
MGETPAPELEIEEDRSAVLWYSAERNAAEKPAETAESENSGTTISIDVLLFGLLSAVTTESPISLSLPSTATPLDVVAALEDRFGADSFAQIKDPNIGILTCCRLFVNGEPFEDPYAPISPDGIAATIEMIILKGFEGG